MENKIKYYMNNPCVVIREISPEMCEIQLNTHFAEDVNGGEWCTECMAGSGYSSHTCGPYQEVIEAIQDDEHSIFCIAETRLIHDEPIEKVQNDFILRKIDALKTELKQRQELQKEWSEDMSRRKKMLDDIKKEYEAIQIAKREILDHI